jgi:glycosyltransferase involved in cell wall biosynthesis
VPSTLKIVFLAWRDLANPLAGGSEVLIDRLAVGLTERGHDVTLVAGGPVAARPYPVIDAGGRYSQYLRARGIVDRRIGDVDLVVDVANGMSYLTPLWRRRPSVCFVNHVHTDQWGLWFAPPIAALGRTIERSVMPRVYRHRLFIAVSPSTAEALAGIGVDPERIRIVPNGVALDAPDVPKSIDPLFVALGRLVPHKRIDVLLETWERVRPRTGGRLVIIGDGPERAKLEAMAGADVTFTGHLDEDAKQRLLAAAWMLVHPSMLEGWGLVVTEAAAAGTPTLAFDAPGVRDSVAHGESGILARNTEDFVERWVAITGNWRWRTELSLGARRRAAQFSWDNTVDRFLSVAYEAVGRPVPVPAAAPPAVEPVPLSTVIERSGG